MKKFFGILFTFLFIGLGGCSLPDWFQKSKPVPPTPESNQIGRFTMIASPDGFFPFILDTATGFFWRPAFESKDKFIGYVSGTFDGAYKSAAGAQAVYEKERLNNVIILDKKAIQAEIERRKVKKE